MLPPSPPFPLLELLEAPPIPELACPELELPPEPFSVPPEHADMTNQLTDTAAKSALRRNTIREGRAIGPTPFPNKQRPDLQAQTRDSAAYVARLRGVYYEEKQVVVLQKITHERAGALLIVHPIARSSFRLSLAVWM